MRTAFMPTFIIHSLKARPKFIELRVKWEETSFPPTFMLKAQFLSVPLLGFLVITSMFYESKGAVAAVVFLLKHSAT